MKAPISMKYLLLTALFFTSLSFSYSQKEYIGYLITVENDTIKGKIKMKMRGAIKNKWTWPHSVGLAKRRKKTGKFKYFDPGEVKGFAIRDKNRKWKVYMSKKVLGRSDQDFVFAPAPAMAGAINFYKTKGHRRGSGPGIGIGNFGPSVSVGTKEFIYYLEKEDRFVYVDADNYKTMMNAFLEDCPDLQGKIGKKGYRFKHLESVVKLANECME